MSQLSDRLSKLSPAKRQLLLRRLQVDQDSGSLFNHQIQPYYPRPKLIPLSSNQQRLWSLTKLQPKSASYNSPLVFNIEGSLDIGLMKQSFEAVIERHEALRTCIGETAEGQLTQKVMSSAEAPPFLAIDLSIMSENRQEAEIRRLATEFVRRPFHLECMLPIRAAILILTPHRRYCMVLVVHHIATDGWSVGILLHELQRFYEAFLTDTTVRLPDLPIQFADFAIWEREWLQSEEFERHLEFWKQQMEGNPPALQLPTNRPRPALQSFQGATYQATLPFKLYQKLKSLSMKAECTLFATLLTSFIILLYRYTGQEDITIGTVMTNRNRPEIRPLIGYLVNTILLRFSLEGNPSVQEFLDRINQTTLACLSHQEFPFDALVRALQPERSLSYSPLFQVLFVLQNVPKARQELPGITFRPFTIETGTAKLDLTLTMAETESGLIGTWEYNSDLFEANTIARMADHLEQLLTAMVQDASQSIAMLPMLTDSEQHQLLIEWNDTAVEYPQDQCIHQLFEVQEERIPDAVAVVFEDQQLTYRELNARANQLAHYLQAIGVGPEVLVSICVDRSLEMLVGLLGILKAGGAYVPLDPNYPQQRLMFMLQDAQAPFLLTQAQLIDTLPEHTAQTICLDRHWPAIAQHPTENLDSKGTADNLAYVIYTSGSTGQPKGVAIQHRSSVALCNWASHTFSEEQVAAVLATTSLCFDLSVFELFVPLSKGGKVILVPSALSLSELTAAAAPSLINTVPSVLTELLRLGALPVSVNTVNLAGEPLPAQLVHKLYQQAQIQEVYNLYGPSEDTTYSTYALMRRNRDVAPSIGRPISNTQVYILDGQLQPTPIGVAGELYIGGAGLARGYLNRPGLTATKFIANPFGTGRLYKTGDLARYLTDGTIEFLGRIDYQVKVRGFRIELGEIEAAINSHNHVHQSVAIVRKDTSGNKRLIAYVVGDGDLDIKELKGFLQQQLPSYMLPSQMVPLDSLPLTSNGKIDRQSLPASQSTSEVSDRTLPETPIQELLCGIWAEVLELDTVSIRDNFFELGGDSILAMQAIFKAKQADLHFMPKDLFQNQTIAELAAIATAKAGQEQLQQDAELARVQAAWENYGQEIAAADLTHIPTDFQHAAPVTPKSETVSMRLSATDTRSLLEALPILYNASTADAILSALVTICCGPKQSLLLSVIGNRPLSAKAPRTTNALSESGNVTGAFPLLLPNGDRQSLGTTLKLIKEAVRQVPNSRMGCSIALGNSDRDRYADLPAAEIAFRYDDPLSEETSHENFDPKPSSTLDSFQTACPEKLAIAARLDSGSLCLHWHYSPDLFQQNTVTQLAQQTLQALQDLATHCQASDAGGYTPSDFPLAQLDTPALHKLFGHNRAIADLYPLSPTQEGMLFHTLYSPHGGTYFDQVSCQIEGALNIECFQQAWGQVIQHYDVLRTAFLWQDLDRPLQAVHHSVELPWTELDWSDADETERSRQLQAFLGAERERGFDLARAPLMRLTLIHLGRDTYYFVWSRHHLLLDGWSLPLVMQSMLSAYETLVSGRDRAVLPSAPPYRDYIGWLQAQNLDEAKAFWQEYLADWTTPLALDRIGARSSKSTSFESDDVRTESSCAECNIPFAADSSDKLNAFTRQHRLTLNTLVQGGWSLLLAHYSGELDIVFGATVAGRPTDLMGIETTVGLFINTLPVRVRIADDASLLAWLQQLQTAQVEGNRYAYSPLAEIQSWSAVPRGRALFETLVVFENYPIDTALKRRVADLSLQGLTNEINNGYPLTLRAVPERELLLQLIYDRDRFDSAVVNAMGEHLKTLLEGAIAQPDIRVGALLQQVRESSQQSFKQARRKKLGQVRRKAIRHSAPTQTEGGN